MNNEDRHIDMIRDYFSGKLDAKAMHALEKRALEDPLLADAMEGFMQHPDKVAQDLDTLQARLQQRVARQHKKSLSLRYWLVAASVILVAAIGSLFIFNNAPKQPQSVTGKVTRNDNIRPPVVKRPDLQPMTAKTGTVPQALAPGPDKIKKEKKYIPANPPAPDKDPLWKNGLAIAIARTDTLKDSSLVADNMTISLKNMQHIQQPPPVGYLLQGRAAGLVESPVRHGKVIKIIDSVTKAPLANVSVASLNNDFSTSSNAEGYFHLPDTLNSVSLSYIGYEKKIVSVNNKVVTLQPANSSLNDVVVIGYSAQRKIRNKNGSRRNNIPFPDKAGPEASRPRTGWKKFTAYILTSVKKSDTAGTKGFVTVSFLILPNGHLFDFKIIKSLSAERDRQAISILKNGPLWTYHAASGPVTYTIEF